MVSTTEDRTRHANLVREEEHYLPQQNVCTVSGEARSAVCKSACVTYMYA